MSQPIPLGLSAYKRADLPPVKLKNYYYEKAPTNREDQVALIPRPRLKLFANAGAGPMRGVFRKSGVVLGRMLALSGGDLYRIEAGAGTLVGAVSGTRRMSAAGNATNVVLAAGASAYSTDGVTLATITIPDGQNVIAVDALNSYFLFAVEASGRFYWSAIGGITVDALDYATAESQADELQTLKVVGDEMLLLGRLSLEFWQPTGDLDLPFQRIDGRIFGIGIVAADTAQKLIVNGSETLAWVGADGRVYRTAPNPVRISDHAMEERIAKADATTLYATTYPWIGHDFYVLHIPGQGSFACDLSTGLWDELTSYGKALFRGAVAAIGPNDEPLLGDDATGKIWELSDEERDDDGDPVIFECTGLVENNGNPVRCNNVVLRVTAGQTPDPEADPMMQMAYSGDGGQTFSAWLESPLGRQGQYLARVIWKKLGLIKRQRLFQWRTTEPVTIRKAKMNEDRA